MKTTIKPHPIMLYSFIKPFLFVLVIPFVKGIVDYIFRGHTSSVMLPELLLIAMLLVFAWFRLINFKIILYEDAVVIKKGFFIKTRAKMKADELSCVRTAQGTLDFLFGSVTVELNTEAGRRHKSDFAFKLRARDAETLLTALYGEREPQAHKFSPLALGVSAAATSSAASGIVLGVPFINQAGKMLGVSLSKMLISEIDNISRSINTYLPPIVNTVTFLALASYSFAFFLSFFRNIGFSLAANEAVAEIKRGFFVKKRIVFKKSSINNLCIDQTPMMRLFRVFSLGASVAGYGGKRERAILIPCGSYKRVKSEAEKLFQSLSEKNEFIKPSGNYKNGRRFLFVPALLSVAVVASAILEGALFPSFTSLGLFVNAVLLCIVAYYGNICLKDYRQSRLSFGRVCAFIGSKGLGWREMYCEKEKLGVIKISQTPADRRFSTCKLKITVRSEGADSIRIKNLDHVACRKALEDEFGIKGII